MGGNVARKKWRNWSFWRIGRLCRATAPPWVDDVEYDAAPWKGKRAVSSRNQEGFDRVRGKGCICALSWQVNGPPGFARSRGGAVRHLKQSGCCGDDGVVKIKVCRPNPMGRRERWCEAGHARQRAHERRKSRALAPHAAGTFADSRRAQGAGCFTSGNPFGGRGGAITTFSSPKPPLAQNPLLGRPDRRLLLFLLEPRSHCQCLRELRLHGADNVNRLTRIRDERFAHYSVRGFTRPVVGFIVEWKEEVDGILDVHAGCGAEAEADDQGMQQFEPTAGRRCHLVVGQRPQCVRADGRGAGVR
eukprot:scaffold10222_cov135-Isochrysis_galbana.AAC.11